MDNIPLDNSDNQPDTEENTKLGTAIVIALYTLACLFVGYIIGLNVGAL